MSTFTDSDIPRYRKKSTRVVAVKSDHKHDYEKYISVTGKMVRVTSRCTICGRQGKSEMFITKRSEENPYCHIWLTTLEEISAEFPELEIKYE